MSSANVKLLINKVINLAVDKNTDRKFEELREDLFLYVMSAAVEIVNDVNTIALSGSPTGLKLSIEQAQKEVVDSIKKELENTFVSSHFFTNENCPMYPCNKTERGINCMYCFCSLYAKKDCGGQYVMNITTDGAIKVCSRCMIPHCSDAYDYFQEYFRKHGE